jgi:hypothetical protein
MRGLDGAPRGGIRPNAIVIHTRAHAIASALGDREQELKAMMNTIEELYVTGL